MAITMARISRRHLKATNYTSVLALTILLCSCEEKLSQPAGPPQTTNFSLDKGTTDHLNLQLNLKAGKLKMRGGSNKLVDAQFVFNVPSFKPSIRSRENGTHSVVTIEQPQDLAITNNARNDWDLQLSDDVRLDLAINCGAGEANLKLGALDLRGLQVHMGAGEVDLDLSGHPTHDYEIEVAGGVGQATIHLPQGVGIRADVHGGLGNIDVQGLQKKGDHYENASYETAKVNVRLKVNGGIGEIRLLE